MRKILIATSNQGKVNEIANFFAQKESDIFSDFSFLALKDVFENIKEPVEDGINFAENALIKAKYYSEASGLPVIADDSGIEVEILNWGPSVYSSRFSNDFGGYNSVFKKLEQVLFDRELEFSRARFICAMAFAVPDEEIKVFQGQVDGKIEFPARGNSGFGYDPIFVADGYDKTFAEMTKEEKNQISHRGRALKKLHEFLYAR